MLGISFDSLFLLFVVSWGPKAVQDPDVAIYKVNALTFICISVCYQRPVPVKRGKVFPQPADGCGLPVDCVRFSLTRMLKVVIQAKYSVISRLFDLMTHQTPLFYNRVKV